MKQKGFTLLEVMISLAILSIAVSSLLVARNNAIKKAKGSIEIRRIKILIEQKMAELVAGIEQSTSGSFDSQENTGYIWKASIERIPIRYSSTSSNQEEVEINMKRIIVIVRRKNSEFEKSLAGYFFIKNPEDEKGLKKKKKGKKK